MTGLFTHRLVMSKTSFVEGFFAFSHGATAKKLLFVPKKSENDNFSFMMMTVVHAYKCSIQCYFPKLAFLVVV